MHKLMKYIYNGIKSLNHNFYLMHDISDNILHWLATSGSDRDLLKI
jgi:hypothetical protein